MRLVSYGSFGSERAGFLDGDEVIDLEQAMKLAGAENPSATCDCSWSSRTGDRARSWPTRRAPRCRPRRQAGSGRRYPFRARSLSRGEYQVAHCRGRRRTRTDRRAARADAAGKSDVLHLRTRRRHSSIHLKPKRLDYEVEASRS